MSGSGARATARGVWVTTLALATVIVAACGASQPSSRAKHAASSTTASTTTVTRAVPTAPPGPSTAPGLGGSAVAVGSGSVWVGRRAAGTSLTGELLRIDPVTLAVQARVPVPVPPRAIAVSGTTAWVAGGGDGALPVGALVAVDTTTNKVVRRYGPTATPWSPVGIAVGSDAVWVADNSRSLVLRLDPRSGAVHSIPVAIHPTSIAVQGADVWVGSDATVWHVDAVTNAARASLVAGTDVVAGNPYIWTSYASPSGRDTTTLDPQGAFLGTSAGTPIRAHFDQHPIGGRLAADGKGVWVAESDDVVLLRVVDDAEARTVPASSLALDQPPLDLAADHGTVWVVAGVGAPLVRWRPAL